MKIKHYFMIIMKINLGLKCYVSQVLDILSVGISIIFIYIILNIINIKLLYYISTFNYIFFFNEVNNDIPILTKLLIISIKYE